MPRHVQGHGSYEAPLLFIGEGPGKTEEMKGQPFIGHTGAFIRACVKYAGMDPEEDVRWNNALPVRCWIPDDALARATLINKHWDHLANDLTRTKAKVIVACGGVALYRLLGLTNILTANGGIYSDGEGRLVIPCLHPAGVRNKTQAAKMTIERTITRAVKYARGELSYRPVRPRVHLDPSVEIVDSVLSATKTVCVDTEFDPNTRITNIVGFTTREAGGKDVWSLTPKSLHGKVFKDMRAVLHKHFTRTDLVKVAHHHFADVEALSWLGVGSCAPWFDTLYVFAALYPDLPAGLSHVARFYLDNVCDWKSMAHSDPAYNAIDVANTWSIYGCECCDITDSQMWPLIEDEVLSTLPLLYGLQQRGLRVDTVALEEARDDCKQEIAQLRVNVSDTVGTLFTKRAVAARTVWDDLEIEAQGVVYDVVAHNARHTMCPVKKHGTYNGLRKKKFTTHDDKCQCANIYNDMFVAGKRDLLASLHNKVRKAKVKAAKWDRGFDPNNNEHLRWLLYDKEGYGLRVQRDKKTKRPTAGATAIAKLITLKSTRDKPGAIELLRKIKRVQHLEKRLGTFLTPPIDSDNVAHPAYRMVTGTGRPASGSDENLAEKNAGGVKFNVLNIPVSVRKIYVPHKGVSE